MRLREFVKFPARIKSEWRKTIKSNQSHRYIQYALVSLISLLYNDTFIFAQEPIHFTCDSGHCVSSGYPEPLHVYSDLSTCLQSCPRIKRPLPNPLVMRSSLGGTCDECMLSVMTDYNFSQLLSDMAITSTSLTSEQCQFTASIEMDLPSYWTAKGNVSHCSVQDTRLPCVYKDQMYTMSLDADSMREFFRETSGYTFRAGTVNTRQDSGSFLELNQLRFKFQGENCVVPNLVEPHNMQQFQMVLASSSYELVGMFVDTKMTALKPEIMEKTRVILSFKNGALLMAKDVLFLRVADTLAASFSELLPTAVRAMLRRELNQQDIPLSVENLVSSLRFQIPDNFTGVIANGELLQLAIDEFVNPNTTESVIDSVYLSAFQNLSVSVDNSPFQFYSVERGKRAFKTSKLDVISIIVFAVCFLVSLIIIQRQGLALTMSTFWTDLVAISALFSFAAAFGSHLSWILTPSKMYIYWFTARYFFNFSMILSLCFHWAVVLSFKGYKKMSLKSPIVWGFLITNAVIFVSLIFMVVSVHARSHCVYDIRSRQCSSMAECILPIPVDGKMLRQAAMDCSLQPFFNALVVGLVVHTLLLMILGCLVMCRGRSLMFLEDSIDTKVRKALAIFYTIIASTCVLYISAQTIAFAQSIGIQAKDSTLPDFAWYTLIIWLPQGVPPILLLFLRWEPQTESFHSDQEIHLIMESRKDYHLHATPRSSFKPGDEVDKPHAETVSIRDSLYGRKFDAMYGSNLRFSVKLKFPSLGNRMCFLSLNYASLMDFSRGSSLETWPSNDLDKVNWEFAGTTEHSCIDEENEIAVFSAVLDLPVLEDTSHTLLQFVLHASKDANLHSLEGCDSSTMDTDQTLQSNALFIPILAFMTTPSAIKEAFAQGGILTLLPSNNVALPEAEDEISHELLALAEREKPRVELSIFTLLLTSCRRSSLKDEACIMHSKNVANLIRFFQCDCDDTSVGLMVEDLRESVYGNMIPRQYIKLLIIEREGQLAQVQEDLHDFVTQKKGKRLNGFYGTLIGQIQYEGDTAVVREWLVRRVEKYKEYIEMLKKHEKLLFIRDKQKKFFKPSVEKKNPDLRFVPINLHIEDFLFGPTTAFLDEKERRNEDISVYNFTTVGAFAAHCYKFNKGGILSLQVRLKKLQDRITSSNIDVTKWPEELREYDDLKWDSKARMDCCFAQALAALTATFVRKIELAIQHPDPIRGEYMLRTLSILGFLFHVESLLSTHGKEIGMLEDMAAAIATLSSVAFVLEDVQERPAGRFALFQSKRPKQSEEESNVVDIQVLHKKGRGRGKTVKYIVKVYIISSCVTLPDRLAAGGEIAVTPVLFTQGINEMQTIANNTERTKTELQDLININNLKPLRAYCDRYCRLALALPHARSFQGLDSIQGTSMLLDSEQVMKEYKDLELCILDAAQSLVKSKRPEILQLSADLCRELGGGRVTICKSAKDRTAMSVTLEQVRILHRHHNLPSHRIPATLSVMRSHGVRVENALKNTGKRQFAFNKLQRSFLPEEYRCPEQVGGGGNVS